MAQKINRLQRNDNIAIAYYLNPGTGQVFGTGTNHITYTALEKSEGSTVTMSGTNLTINTAGWYTVTGNVRIIDVPVPIIQQIQVSVDGGTTWQSLANWSHRVTPESTNRSAIPVTASAYLPVGTLIRHSIDTATNNTRIGALTSSFGKYQTSLTIAGAA